MKCNVTKDLNTAAAIVNFDVVPSVYSFNSLYKGTNEKLSKYVHFFAGKKRMLSVIASGEQIFNAILEGVNEIEAFDICPFAKYYLFLKKAGIQALTREEYIDFFYKKAKESHNKLYFDKIRTYLDDKSLIFWDNLFQRFGWEKICFSLLFFRDPIDEEENIINNKYLEPANFERMKEFLAWVKIKVYTGDILKIVRKFKQESDLIYLSNISFYTGIKTYLQMHSKLRLAPNGISLSYNMKLQPEDIKPKHLKNGTFSDIELSGSEKLTIYQRAI